MKQKLLNKLWLRGGMLVAILCTLFAGQAWADTYSYTFTSNAWTQNGSATLNGVVWTLNMNGGTISNFSDSSGMHFGTNNNTCNSVSISSSGISGTITSVAVEACRGASLVGNLSVKVGNTSFTTTGDKALTTSNTEYTFTGSESGTIDIKWTKTSGKGALYIKSITVIYSSGSGGDTYTVTYNANGGTGEDFVDDNGGAGYESGATVTVLDNEGSGKPNFAKTGYSFFCWSDMEDGNASGATLYDANDTFEITGNTTLYAQWEVNQYNVTVDDVANVDLYAEYGTNSMLVEGENGDIDYGTELTLTADGLADGYVFNWLITDENDTDVTSEVLSGNTLTVPAYDITISGTAVQTTTYTITFNAGNGTCNTATMSGASGAEITLPVATPSQVCQDAGWAFAGWATSSVSETSTAPTLLTGAYTITADVTLYAVYVQSNSTSFEYDFSEQGYTNGVAITSGTMDATSDIGWAATKGTNDPAYYTSGSGLRVYNGGTFSITTNGNTITYVSLTFSGDGYTFNSNDSNPTEWSGSQSTDISWSVTRTCRLQKVNVTYGGSSTYATSPVVLEKVATPVITLEEGTYTEEKTTTITCTTADATIYYTTDGTDPTTTSTEYTGAITIDHSMTIKAIAVKEGMADSDVATATYTINLPLTTMDAILAKALEVGDTPTNVVIVFNNWVVSGCTNRYAYVTDGTKGFVIYDSSNGLDFVANQKLNGTVSCNLELAYGYARVSGITTSTEGLTVTNDGSVTVANIAMADLEAVNTGALVSYENLTCSVSNGKYYLSDGTTTLQVYTTLFDFGTLEDGETYNITGIYQQYNTTKEILPRSAADIVEIVPNAQTLTVSATNGSVEITGKTLDNGSCEVAEGASVTATATPAEHYTFTSWTAEGVTLDDATANPVTFTMPTNDVTLTANFTENAKHTATFYVQGAMFGTDDVYVGEAIPFPASVTAPTGYTFMGWTTTAINGSQNGAPATLVSSANMGNSDVDYYAVFAISSGRADTYELVEDEDDLEDGDQVVLYSTGSYKASGVTYEFSKANGSISGSLFTDVDVSVSDNAFSSTEVEPMTLVKSGDNWIFKIGDQFVSAANKGVGLDDTGSENSITISSGEATITASINSVDYTLQYNPNSGNGRFAYYSSTQKPVSIYKKDAVTTSNYCTTLSTESVTVTTAGYATYCSENPLYFTPGGDITAYVGTIEGTKLTFTPINQVPANTGLLLVADGGATVDVPVIASAPAVSNNCLTGVNTATTLDAEDYILNVVGGKAGFYKAGSSHKSLVAHRAYISKTAGAGVKSFVFDDDDPTSIQTIDNGQQTTDGAIYNVAGQRLNKMQKGINIVNGKKVLK